MQDHIVRGNGPTAVESRLGYLLSGPLSTCSQNPTARLLQVSALCCMEVPSTEKFWNVEAAGITRLKGDLDKQFLRSYTQSSVICQADGSYNLRFPWKEDHPPLPSNYSVCEKRVRSLARRLAHTIGAGTPSRLWGQTSDSLSPWNHSCIALSPREGYGHACSYTHTLQLLYTRLMPTAI